LGTLTDIQSIRELIGEPTEKILKGERDRLDKYDRLFLSMSPFLCLGTSSDSGADVSVRGDPPGFVKVIDNRTILIPERPGNRRADSMKNLVENPLIGIVSFIPGVAETLRICGRGSVVTDPELLAGTEVQGKAPRVGIKVEIDRVFFHCGKAIIRSDLWGDRYKIDRSEFPSLAQILHDQRWGGDTEDIQAEIDESYQKRLY
jgi:uncharacterized protein